MLRGHDHDRAPRRRRLIYKRLALLEKADGSPIGRDEAADPGDPGRRRSRQACVDPHDRACGLHSDESTELDQLVRQTRVIVRKQYYFRASSRGLLAWDVDRLVRLSSDLPRKHVPLGHIRELDEVWSGDDEPRTWRAMLEHVKLMDGADLSFPIILSATGAVMDGRHRVAKAVREGRTEIEAVQFDEDPEPDYVGRRPEDLPYD